MERSPTLYTIDLASKLLALARSEALCAVEIERLDEIRITLEQYRTTGLTEKNRRLIRQIAQSDVWREVVRLPHRLMAEARANRKTKPLQGRRHGTARDRHPYPNPRPGPHAEPGLDLHRDQSDQTRRGGGALYARLPRL